MAPPLEAWPAHELPARVQALPNGRRRKTPVDLAQCALAEITQFSCTVESRGAGGDGAKGGAKGKAARKEIVCVPIVRLFRRCEGGLTVETTALEPEKAHLASVSAEARGTK